MGDEEWATGGGKGVLLGLGSGEGTRWLSQPDWLCPLTHFNRHSRQLHSEVGAASFGGFQSHRTAQMGGWRLHLFYRTSSSSINRLEEGRHGTTNEVPLLVLNRMN